MTPDHAILIIEDAIGYIELIRDSTGEENGEGLLIAELKNVRDFLNRNFLTPRSRHRNP